ncbi:hypothetical protein O3P69_012206 [Scylla paramamosain]|uniref:Adenosine kinase n=1 Tax=Scylla paramamosain TaxID=85552 RepID=A0AAW0TDK5_SCYPA
MEKYPVEYTAGGCALNSSRVFCWVLGEPHRVVFVGGIGKDEAARRLSDIVEESGVITRFVKVDDQPTGVCVALVLGACRCLCADIGAAATCLPHHVFAPHLTPVLEEAEFIYVEGYFITHSFPAALQVKAALRQHPTQHSAPRQHEAREPAGHSLERLVLTSTVSLKPCAGVSLLKYVLERQPPPPPLPEEWHCPLPSPPDGLPWSVPHFTCTPVRQYSNGSPHTSESEAQTKNTDTTAGKIVITAVMLPLLSSLVRKAKDVRWNNDGGDTLPPERHLTSLLDATSWAAQSPERLQHHGSPSNFPCGLRWSSGGPLVV